MKLVLESTQELEIGRTPTSSHNSPMLSISVSQPKQDKRASAILNKIEFEAFVAAGREVFKS